MLKSKYKKVRVLPIWKAESNVLSVGRLLSEKLLRVSLSDDARNVRLCFPYSISAVH